MNEDVFPIEHGEFFQCHLSFQGCKWDGDFDVYSESRWIHWIWGVKKRQRSPPQPRLRQHTRQRRLAQPQLQPRIAMRLKSVFFHFWLNKLAEFPSFLVAAKKKSLNSAGLRGRAADHGSLAWDDLIVGCSRPCAVQWHQNAQWWSCLATSAGSRSRNPRVLAFIKDGRSLKYHLLLSCLGFLTLFRLFSRLLVFGTFW